MKTQRVKCLSVRELYNMAVSGQPINSHYHKLFDAPDCDLDDESVIMCSDSDDVIDIAQARADMELQKIVNQEDSSVKNKVVDEPADTDSNPEQKEPQSIDVEDVVNNVKS